MSGWSRARVVRGIGWTLGIVIAAGVLLRAGPAGADEPCVHGWATVGPYDDRGGFVYALAVYDDGNGPALYAGGEFKYIGGIAAQNIARWDGKNWAPLGEGTDGMVMSMTVFDDGSGPSLFVGGRFKHAGDQAAQNVARWDGQEWHALGDGVKLGSNNFGVRALLGYDDGQGLALWVGGDITKVGGENASCIARWDGEAWHALPGEFREVDYTDVTEVGVFLPYDDGRGPALFVGGAFDGVGKLDAPNIARWDGSEWSAIGKGLPRGTDLFVPTVGALTTFDAGDGTRLLAGGALKTEYNVQVWDGSSWMPMVRTIGGPIISSLLAAQSPDHPGLFAAGSFSQLYDGSGHWLVTSKSIARWDGQKWYKLAAEDLVHGSRVVSLVEFDDGSGSAVYAGGLFSYLDGLKLQGLARYGCLMLGDMNCDGGVDFNDIDAFALALSDPKGYRGTYTSCDINHADLNGDGKVNFDDIDPFVLKLIGQ